MTPWFLATQSFTSDDGERWRDYVAFSGLTQLREVVSLDGLLCPTVLPEVRDDFWPHIVAEDSMLHFFLDFDFLMRQAAAIERQNVLCVFRNPRSVPRHRPWPPSSLSATIWWTSNTPTAPSPTAAVFPTYSPTRSSRTAVFCRTCRVLLKYGNCWARGIRKSPTRVVTCGLSFARAESPPHPPKSMRNLAPFPGSLSTEMCPL